ncbi:putative nuclear RNA export factor SDE5 isoform X2 [Rhododendron vialii]|uniref:putative nuclear RNA export factor SDE5 isoform X2 n=1 Tax=Rhododendron vialii TaxID=182163 RepID=UPI00265DC11B|nr:putative nuclear RNA export factor SDE5 isoform X2 [Rhododendron vialii]
MSKVKTEELTSNTSWCNYGDKRDLEQLLDAFGSAVSLKDIASAYCQADCDIYAAGELLCNLQGSTSSSCAFASKEESLASDDDLLDKSNLAETNGIASKPKKCSASMGTVSGLIGREYSRSRPSRNEAPKTNKPLKLSSEDVPVSEIWDERVPTDMSASVESMPMATEEFIFKMLGDGFQLDLKIIHEVLGRCGYDVQMSMEKLLDLSACTLENCNDVLGMAAQKPIEKYSESKSLSCREQPQHISSARSDKDRYTLQKEVLEALFTVPERSEEAPEKIIPVRNVRRSRGFGRVVVGPLKDTTIEHKTVIAKLLVTEDENEEDENSYQVLRKAVKEYWTTMKEYYKAAVDAFAKGDPERANKLLEEGHFFKEKARDADEKSAKKFLETREEDVVSLDLHEQDPKEAISLLRIHLSTLSGIPSIEYLKIIVGANAEDSKEGARKRRVMKLLEKESIKWSEERNGRTIVVRLDEIDPKGLSFAKKSSKKLLDD